MNDHALSVDLSEGYDPRITAARQVFNPYRPIADQSLFSGRADQLQQGLAAIQTSGKHPILYGHRGVGKTSLANILKNFSISRGYAVASCQCNTRSTFKTIARELLAQLYHLKGKMAPGFVSKSETEAIPLSTYLAGDFSPETVVRLLVGIGGRALLVIDEFDQVKDKQKEIVANLIKVAADVGGDAVCLVVVGVGETLDDILKKHLSVERNIAQICLSPMSRSEVCEIIERGSAQLTLKFNSDVIETIVACSQGFPYFAQLLAQHCCVKAILQKAEIVDISCFQAGLTLAMSDVDRSIKRVYSDAIHSNRPSRFADILYVSAVTESDEFGYFSARDVAAKSTQYAGLRFSAESLRYPLTKLCTKERGQILSGHTARKSYFRFSNPMMRQYLVMKKMAF